MLPSLLTVLCFASSALAGERTVRFWGAQLGNLLRLTIACVVMWSITFAFFPGSVRLDSFAWLFVSGVVGFGIGDIALFHAYARLGARLTILLNLCTAPLWSAAVEWVWLGTVIAPRDLVAAATILAGVILALLAREPGRGTGSRLVGILAGLVAGCGQGLGAVISRKAFEVAAAGGFELNGLSAASQRVAGGLTMAMIFCAALAALGRLHSRPAVRGHGREAFGWLLGSALFGPVLGVSCFQWALHDLPAALVTAVVATTPIALIPLAVAFNGERPRPLAIAGSVIAVAGVILLVFHAR